MPVLFRFALGGVFFVLQVGVKFAAPAVGPYHPQTKTQLKGVKNNVNSYNCLKNPQTYDNRDVIRACVRADVPGFFRSVNAGFH
jgi:hypothetical protein